MNSSGVFVERRGSAASEVEVAIIRKLSLTDVRELERRSENLAYGLDVVKFGRNYPEGESGNFGRYIWLVAEDSGNPSGARVDRLSDIVEMLRKSLDNIRAGARDNDVHSASDDGLWLRVKDALASPKFDFRTYSGIARSLNVSIKDVTEEILKHKDEVRFSIVRTRAGDELFTLATRPKSWRERLSEMRYILKAVVH